MHYSIVMKRPEVPAHVIAKITPKPRAYLIGEEPTRIMSREDLEPLLEKCREAETHTKYSVADSGRTSCKAPNKANARRRPDDLDDAIMGFTRGDE